jgi:hypothetical protein
MADMPDDELEAILWANARTMDEALAIRARLTPEWTKEMTVAGVRCADAESDLTEFFDFEGGSVEAALPRLLGILKGRGVGVLTMIADMLDPDKPGPWKLELKRNLRGVPSNTPGSYHHWMAYEYFELFEELKEQGVRSPAKEAVKRLLARMPWHTPNEIRAAVHWWRKRGIKLKR